MTDDQFDGLLRDAAATYHTPPEPPLDEMWTEIGFGRPVHSARARSWPLERWLPIAAVFAFGIALGRASSWHGAASSAGTSTVATAEGSAADGGNASAPQNRDEVATSQYLGQTAALLVALPSELHRPIGDSSFVANASDLLLTTRLMLDSPASTDVRLRNLLEDLELVLAQVVRLQHDRSPSEIDLINQALEQRNVIPRLRSAVVDHTAN